MEAAPTPATDLADLPIERLRRAVRRPGPGAARRALTRAELRKLRDYEQRNANRKTVLDRIDRKLR